MGAREINQAATLMFALGHAAVLHLLRGNYAATAALSRELTNLAEQKDARFPTMTRLRSTGSPSCKATNS